MFSDLNQFHVTTGPIVFAPNNTCLKMTAISFEVLC